MAGSQSFFHGALGWDDWIWWSAIGAVGLFLLMLMLCCCVCVRRAKRNGRREAMAQANARRREREQQQRAELQYAQAREQQFAHQNQNQNSTQTPSQNPYSYSKPEPPAPAPYAQPYAQQPPQPPQQPYQDPYARQQPAPYAQQQQQQQQPPYQDPYAPQQQQQTQFYRDPYNRSPAMAPQQPQQPQQQQQPKFYPPPASPPPARQTQTQTQYGNAPSPVRLPPTRQMYEGTPEPPYANNQTSPVHETARRYQNRSVTAPDQLPLLQYGQTRKNSRPSSRLSGTTLSTQDTFNTPDTTSNPDDVPFVPVTSPMSLQQRNTFENFAPAAVPVPPPVAVPMQMQAPMPSNIRDSNASIPSRASTQSRRGPTLKDRIDALRAGGVQDSNHTRISFGSDQDPLTAAAAPSASPLQSFKQEEKDRLQQSLFQQQLSAKSDLDDSFVSDNSAAFGSSFASVESQEEERQRTLLTPRDDENFRRQASRSTDSRESVEF